MRQRQLQALCLAEQGGHAAGAAAAAAAAGFDQFHQFLTVLMYRTASTRQPSEMAQKACASKKKPHKYVHTSLRRPLTIVPTNEGIPILVLELSIDILLHARIETC